MNPIFSSAELRRITEAIKESKTEIETTFDLGRTTTTLNLNKKGVIIKKKTILVPSLELNDKCCYVLLKNKLEKVQFFSPQTNLFYKLIPTSFRPIMQCSGTSMHKKEFVERIDHDKINGVVLDAGTGLGYTAIAAAAKAQQVITVECDDNVTRLAEFNPYSAELFSLPNIERKQGNIVELIKEFPDRSFDIIIFDAGTPKSSDAFFSLGNYQQAHRVLKRNGYLYHYLPKHHLKRGRDFGRETIDRMIKAGFRLVERKMKESYVVMVK
ncbi:TPA: methyltransferase domain-containing protein [Candidatus Woesearchaeota archaeon]|nr:methyltransferase domain-containing protein [Candidatus Woesearchaeota archaeon]